MPPASTDTSPTRLDRRKARTRRALIDAAARLLARRRTDDISIQEITDEADVGFGSFYNHFETKAELLQTAVGEVLDRYGEQLDAACEGVADWAERYAIGVRMTARLATSEPAVAQILTVSGNAYLTSEQGLAPRALRDIEGGIAAGRFHVENPVLAMLSTAGSVLTFISVRLTSPETLDDDDADELAEQLLRMLGMTAKGARSVARRPLPELATTARVGG
ncbi:MAG: TetR/AcrR family transcriptional regulator [Candidatus Nanopelagicales bacterium]